MIEAAEAAGTIIPGVTTIVEPTSGNTGIASGPGGCGPWLQGLLTMPETMSVERVATCCGRTELSSY